MDMCSSLYNLKMVCNNGKHHFTSMVANDLSMCEGGWGVYGSKNLHCSEATEMVIIVSVS